MLCGVGRLSCKELESYDRGEQSMGTRSGKSHYQRAWGRCGSLLHSTAFPATQSNKYLLSMTLPICLGPPLAEALKSVQAAG